MSHYTGRVIPTQYPSDDLSLVISKSFAILCPSPIVLNLFPNVDECKKFEIRSYSCWGEH